MEELNSHQMEIINNLTFKKEAGFAELNTEEIPSDQFSYHIRKLVKDGYISKNPDNKYSLTNKGKEYSGRTDIYNKTIEKQAKTGMIPACVKIENGEKKYLMHLRKKHPYYDYIGFPSGKAKKGNTFVNEVLRELEEETGLIAKNPELKIIQHSVVNLKETKELVEDKVFYIFLITEFENEITFKTLEGENYWMTKEEIFNSGYPTYESTKVTLELLEKEGISFYEEEVEVESL